MTTSTPKRKWTAAWSLVWCLQILSGSLSPVWAQRRRAEPEPAPARTQEQKPGEASSEAGAEESPEVAGQPAPSGQEVQIGAVAPAKKGASEGPSNPLETRIVVRVKSAPLATFLDTISAQAKVNFIITEGLEDKKITAFLQNVTVREALQILLEIKGLTYQRIGKSNTYVVSPRAKGIVNRITRIYTLSYIPLVSIKADDTDLLPKSSSDNMLTTPTTKSGEEGKEDEESTVAIFKVLRSVLSKQYGSIAVDARTNSIIITDIPEVFPQVEQILAELDKKAPQVMIEAQIVEIDSEKAQQLGLEWGGSNGELATFTGPKRDTTFPLNLPTKLSNTHFFDPLSGTPTTLVVSGLANTQGGGGGGDNTGGGQLINSLIMQSGVLDLTQLRVVLRALVQKAEARFLGKPKVLTLNNKSAKIQIAQQQAVSIQVVTTASNALATQTVTVTRFPTGLTLKVTPQVNREGFITMLVEPSFTDVTESAVSSPVNKIYDPIVRAASTLVRVKNGQTLVLGGLLQSRENKTVRKVPFFGYIPLIGWLFTSTNSRRANTDLVIFITPTVVND